MKQYYLKLILLLILSMVGMAASAFECISEGFVFEVSGNEATLVKDGSPSYEGLINVTIPSTISYNGKTYTVTAIGNGAFRSNTTLKSIRLPDEIKTIKQYAFNYCSNLSQINIPSKVESIENYAFQGCNSLAKVIIPDVSSWCLIKFGYYANPLSCSHRMYKSETEEITVLNIPEGVSSIGTFTFEDFSALTSVNIPSSVISVGKRAFYGCSNLAKVTTCEGLINIGEDAFSGCETLVDFTIPNSVTSIGVGAFMGCVGLKSISVPSKVTELYQYTFSYCTGLTNVTLSEGLISIGNSTFEGCTSLSYVYIPSTVSDINYRAFRGCDLKKISVSEANVVYDSRENCNAIVNTKTNEICKGSSNTTFPLSIIGIASEAFANCKSLTTLKLPSSITYVKSSAFSGCTGLTTIEIPSSITEIASSVFAGCTGLKEIVLPQSIITIDSYAFSGCLNLNRITIPKFVTKIGNWAFSECKKIKDIVMKPTEPCSLQWSSFSYSALDSISTTLYVPKGSKSKYESAEYWNNFKGHIFEIGDSLQIKDILMMQGKNIALDVNFNNGWNEDVYTAYQFTLHLPDSIGIAQDEDGEYECDLVADRYQGKTHRLNVTEKDTLIDEDGTVWRNYQFICYSDKNKLIKGAEGPLLTITLTLDKNINVKTEKDKMRYGVISDITFSDENMDGDLLENVSFKIDLYPAGDVNYDYKVDVKDIVGVVSCINRQISEEETMTWNAADVNNDESVNVKDIVNIIDIINKK